jgi:hypothetical protein
MSIDLSRAPVYRAMNVRFEGHLPKQLRDWRDQGLSRRQAAAVLGVSPATLRTWIDTLEIDWPLDLQAQSRRLTQALSARTPKRIQIGDEWMSFAEAARRSNVPLSTLFERYKLGDRGKRLLRRKRRYRKPTDCYRVGISRREWQQVVDYATKHGKKATHNRLKIPMGAITAAMRGEWERLN